ncbi:MAG UNVERIFIED_CONTAM: hypothetical protein LVR18_15700 [Planctomycetaceae bacterium]|jgi:hypothetical protein
MDAERLRREIGFEAARLMAQRRETDFNLAQLASRPRHHSQPNSLRSTPDRLRDPPGTRPDHGCGSA